MNNRSSIIHERFWSKVAVSEVARCWPWTGAVNENGYGQFRHDGRTIKAHRVAYFLRNGEWPDNACHHCDNPICCNPDHIFSGTHADNMRDMVLKGRHKADRGERHGSAVLTESKVLAMRAQYKGGGRSMKSLAKEHGCSFSTAQRVIKRKNWAHLP